MKTYFISFHDGVFTTGLATGHGPDVDAHCGTNTWKLHPEPSHNEDRTTIELL